MSMTVVGIGGIIGLFALFIFHVPLAIALISVGIIAFAAQTDLPTAANFLANGPAQVMGNVDLATVPLFLLMGAFVSVSGFSRDLYSVAAAFLGWRKGGLAYATIGGSAAFGAICGSSPATAATFTKVALPEMLERGYKPEFAASTIAAGGALKSLIPPSLTMLLYCIVARTYIFDVFIAAIVPAALTIVANLVAIAVIVRFSPGSTPVSQTVGWDEKLAALVAAFPALGLIIVIFTGLYSGIFTVNEAASVAAVGSFVFAALRRRLSRSALIDALCSTASVAGMIYFVLIGSEIFTYFINLAKIPEQLILLVQSVDLPPLAFIFILLAVYLFLGAVFDELAAMIVTLPFVLPVILHLGYDPVWWAIINVVIIELGLIVPPLGLIILIIHSMRPDLQLSRLYKHVAPFILVDVLVLIVLVLFPQLSLWLPAWANS